MSEHYDLHSVKGGMAIGCVLVWLWGVLFFANPLVWAIVNAVAL